MRMIAEQGLPACRKQDHWRFLWGGSRLVSEGAELAGKLPIWAFPGGFYAESYSSSEARGKNLADESYGATMSEKESDRLRRRKDLLYQSSQDPCPCSDL